MDMDIRKRRGAVRKMRGKAGETLTETLVAMLIIGLSSVLFLTMVAASSRIFQNAKDRYGEVYGIITKADLQEGAPIDKTVTNVGTIIVEGPDSTFTTGVDWYGDQDYVLSYKR